MTASAAVDTVAIYIAPPSRHFRRNQLFVDRPGTGDNLQAPYRHVRDYFAGKGIAVRTSDYLPATPDGTTKLYVSIGMPDDLRRLARRPDVVLSAFFAMECPIVEPSMYRALPKVQRHFRRVYSWSDSDALARFAGEPLKLKKFFWPQAFDGVHQGAWSNTGRKFLVMINSNKLPRLYWNELYTERLRAVEYFSRSGEIDLYGMGWDRTPARVGTTWVPWTVRKLQDRWQRFRHKHWPDPLLAAAQRVYRGPARSKSEVLGGYKFALCFENGVIPGWITEKIFDCFFAGTVPVYWGAPDITDYIPAGCFIDRREFRGYEHLRGYLRGMSGREIERYRENARAFVESSGFHRFSKDNFLGIFRAIAREDAGLDL